MRKALAFHAIFWQCSCISTQFVCPTVEKDVVSERLRALAKDARMRSKAARLRDVVEDVEATLAAGVSRTHVLQVLKECGLDMSPATFDSALTRIRSKRGKPTAQAKPKADASASKAVATDTHVASKIPPHLNPSYDPKAIDRILATVPDLDAYSKLAKKFAKK